MGKIKNIQGNKYGMLTVLEMSNFRKRGEVYWECKCDCGKTISVNGCDLRAGKRVSCGCYIHNKRHDMSRTRLYKIWSNMIDRCKRGKEYYENIEVFEDWLFFENFYIWSSKNGYKEDLTIDRIDNSLGYCPSNCRWVTKKTQARNRKISKLDENKANIILSNRQLGRPFAESYLAKIFGCTPAAIYNVGRTSWLDIESNSLTLENLTEELINLFL